MKTLLRILRLYALTLWVGGIVFFIVVAAVAFGNLPSTHEAGLVVRGSLIAIHSMGLTAGCIYLIATLLLIFAFGDRTRPRQAELLLIAAMMILTTYSQYSIIPTMERDRLSLQQQFHSEVDQTPKEAAAHADFDRLHDLSTRVEGAVLLAGLLLLALAAIPERVSPKKVARTYM